MIDEIIKIRKGKTPYSTTIAIPAPIARELENVHSMKVEWTGNRLVYTPVSVEIKEMK